MNFGDGDFPRLTRFEQHLPTGAIEVEVRFISAFGRDPANDGFGIHPFDGLHVGVVAEVESRVKFPVRLQPGTAIFLTFGYPHQGQNACLNLRLNESLHVHGSPIQHASNLLLLGDANTPPQQE